MDGNKENNRLDNLEWSNRFRNTAHAIRNKLIKSEFSYIGVGLNKSAVKSDLGYHHSWQDYSELQDD